MKNWSQTLSAGCGFVRWIGTLLVLLHAGHHPKGTPSFRTCRGLSLLLLGPWRSCPWSPPPSSLSRVRLIWWSTPVSYPQPSPPAQPRAASQGLHRPRPLNASIAGGGSNLSLTPLRRLETTGDCSPDMAEKERSQTAKGSFHLFGSYRSGHLSQNGDILLKWTLQTYSCFPASFQAKWNLSYLNLSRLTSSIYLFYVLNYLWISASFYHPTAYQLAPMYPKSAAPMEHVQGWVVQTMRHKNLLRTQSTSVLKNVWDSASCRCCRPRWKCQRDLEMDTKPFSVPPVFVQENRFPKYKV